MVKIKMLSKFVANIGKTLRYLNRWVEMTDRLFLEYKLDIQANKAQKDIGTVIETFKFSIFPTDKQQEFIFKVLQNNQYTSWRSYFMRDKIVIMIENQQMSIFGDVPKEIHSILAGMRIGRIINADITRIKILYTGKEFFAEVSTVVAPSN